MFRENQDNFFKKDYPSHLYFTNEIKIMYMEASQCPTKPDLSKNENCITSKDI